MNISYYSQYSDGVKTRNKSNRLLNTRSRAMLGAFVLDRDSPTNIDPNKLLMRKESARLFTVNLNDIETLVKEKGYTMGKAIAYYECVTQIPQASRKHDFYTNKKHGLPLIAKEAEIAIPIIKWYANSWTGHSWVANRSKKDGGAPCFWTKDLEVINDPFSKAWKLYDERFPRRGWRISYDVHDTVEIVYARLLSFIALHNDEPEIHVWIQGNLNGLDPSKMVSRLQKMLSSDGGDAHEDSEASDEVTDIIEVSDDLAAMKLDFQPERTKEYISLWNTPLEESHDTWEMYGSRSPQRIPVIPWRVSNLGARTFHKGIPPQLFPPSTFMFERGIGINELKFTEIYSNYSEHVKLRTLTQEDVDTLDYAWLPVGPNMYAMSPIKTGDVRDSTYGLLTVEDRAFFMGCGSVVTAAHACFGLGRSNKDLIFQKERKDNTKHGTSGHMIASVLAFQSHFLWYMEEVYYNLKTKSSVYAVPFNEPEGGAYHTIHEYRNAIHDMQIIDTKGLYPKYARNNLEICKTLFRYLY